MFFFYFWKTRRLQLAIPSGHHLFHITTPLPQLCALDRSEVNIFPSSGGSGPLLFPPGQSYTFSEALPNILAQMVSFFLKLLSNFV